MIKRNKSVFTNPLALISLGCVLAFAAACGDDDDSSGETPGGGTKATGGASTAGTKATGGSAGKGNTPTAGGPTEEVGGGGAGTVPVPEGGSGGQGSCVDDADNGCFSCPPKTHDEFLNHCPTTGCEPFDNSVLSSIKNGKLPDLP